VTRDHLSEETRARISKSQRERYERERDERARLRSELHRFALWLSDTWDEENEDDVYAALARVDAFLANDTHSEGVAP
jgi:hypothetical protein